MSTAHSCAIEATALVKDVKVGFFARNKRLLDRVDLRVPIGAVQGFVGPNGAGKSTTIKHLIGGSRPTTGSVRVYGGDPFDPRIRARLGYMAEVPNLPATLTANEILRLHGALGAVRADAARSKHLVEVVGLAEHANTRVFTYSKGMQARLCLALALLHDPELLILDEPMSGLDPIGRRLVRDVIVDEAKRGKTILFSSHVLSDVEQLCDRVTVVDRGRVVYEGDVGGAVGDVVAATEIHVRGTQATDAQLQIPGVTAIRRAGDRTILTVSGRDGLEVAWQLRSAGLHVESLEHRRQTLEERVLRLLQGSTA